MSRPNIDIRQLIAAADMAKQHRAAMMKDEQEALWVLHEAYTRLTELGFRPAIYAPKGTVLRVIEAGSSAVHDDARRDEFGFWIADHGDVWPSHPILFKANTAREGEKGAE